MRAGDDDAEGFRAAGAIGFREIERLGLAGRDFVLATDDENLVGNFFFPCFAHRTLGRRIVKGAMSFA